MSNVKFNGETERADCTEIKPGDVIVEDGSPGVLSYVDATDQYIEGTSLDGGKSFTRSAAKNGEDGVLLVDVVRKGSISIN